MSDKHHPRVDFAAIAKSLRLLPDGAIERINDWAYDQFDERLLDEDGDMMPEELLDTIDHRKQLIAACGGS
jgi:hypothetical protein